MDDLRRRWHVEREVGAKEGDPLGEIIPCRLGQMWVLSLSNEPQLAISVYSTTPNDRYGTFRDLIDAGNIKVMMNTADGFDAALTFARYADDVLRVMGGFPRENVY
jgi:hypothetical protein